MSTHVTTPIGLGRTAGNRDRFNRILALVSPLLVLAVVFGTEAYRQAQPGYADFGELEDAIAGTGWSCEIGDPVGTESFAGGTAEVGYCTVFKDDVRYTAWSSVEAYLIDSPDQMDDFIAHRAQEEPLRLRFVVGDNWVIGPAQGGVPSFWPALADELEGGRIETLP